MLAAQSKQTLANTAFSKFKLSGNVLQVGYWTHQSFLIFFLACARKKKKTVTKRDSEVTS